MAKASSRNGSTPTEEDRDASQDSLNRDLMLARHSNGMAVLCLSPLHFLLSSATGGAESAAPRRMVSVSFNTGSGSQDRSGFSTTGKSKTGAIIVEPQTCLCVVQMADGASHRIHAGFRSKLVELNHRIVSHPQLLELDPHASGYLAIVDTRLQNRESISSGWLSLAAYEQARGRQLGLPQAVIDARQRRLLMPEQEPDGATADAVSSAAPLGEMVD